MVLDPTVVQMDSSSRQLRELFLPKENSVYA